MRLFQGFMSGVIILALAACNPFAKKGDDSFIQSLSDKIKGNKESTESDWNVQKDPIVNTQLPSTVETSGNLLVSDDQKSQITMPTGWGEMNDLNDKADLQAGNAGDNMYFIVLSESKKDFTNAMTMEQHSDITRKSLKKSLSDITEQGPFHTVVNGKPAVQYEILANFKTLRVGYLHTTVETDNNFHQLLAWTTYEKFSGSGRQVIDQVVSSFQER